MVEKNKSKYIIDKVTRVIFLICALIAVISLVLIIGFVFYKGLRPFFAEGKSFTKFLEHSGIQHLMTQSMEYYL